VQAVVLRRVQRRHPDRHHGIDALGDGDADHVIDRALLQQVGSLPVVRAEAEAALGEG
jgi:hypothetical protein